MNVLNSQLDFGFVNIITPDNLIKEYYLYKKSKTDDIISPPKVKIQLGVDGVSWQAFEKQLSINCKNIYNTLLNGNYFFKPLREVKIAKRYGDSLQEAIKNNNFRVISIACLRDILVQKAMYKALLPHFEKQFNKLNNVSFAYRPSMSAPSAAKLIKEYINRGTSVA